MTPKPATTDDLWEWLLACLDCGRPHQYRRTGVGYSTWVADDGHAYRTRLRAGAWGLHTLRAEWEELQELQDHNAHQDATR